LHHPTFAGAVAAVLLHIRDQTGQLPHVYFTWSEDHPLSQLIQFFLLGVGEVTVRTASSCGVPNRIRPAGPTVHVS
jgi:hypothetical protein